jgi:hypothetical protein
MKTKKKLKKSSIKKYANGTQVLGNVDPTTMYDTNRNKTVADNQFNNAQQAELNKGLIKQQYQDTTNKNYQNLNNVSASTQGARSTISSAASALGPAGMIIGAGIGIAGGMGDSLNKKVADKELAGGKRDYTTRGIANVIDPTTNLVQGLGLDGGGMNASDLVSGLTAGLVNLKGSKEDKATDAAVASKKQQEYVDNQISKYGAIDNTVQNTQLKKGTKKLKARIIETEGPEPIFSPKDSSGERKLLYHDPNGPTHKEGGVKAAVIQSGKDKIRGMLNIPEGSAIVTRDNNMNQKALKAYKEGDKNKLNKIINQMPSDTNSKKEDGDNELTVDEEVIGKKPIEQDLFGLERNIKFSENQAPLSNSTITTKSKKTYNTSSLKNMGTGLLQAAPSIYNLGRGLFEKAKTTNRRYINNEAYKYQDLADPNRKAANEQFRIESSNIRNATGGSGGAYLANQNLAAANRFRNLSDINNQEAGKRLDISNTNTNLRNQQNAQNLQLANQYDDLDTQNIARKNDFVGAGLTGLSDLSFNKQLMKNQANADRLKATTLETTNFKYDPEKEQKIFKNYKKGNKFLKYKKK